RFSRTPAGMLTAMVLASVLILMLGAAWLSLFLHVSFSRALLLGAVPFIPGDLIKIALACVLVRRMSA
ncbi:MAG: biotin transporter BioY, partial [Bacteroidales bacterium]